MKRNTRLFVVCLVAVILTGFLAGLIYTRLTRKSETIHSDHNVAVASVTEKGDDYIIADVSGYSWYDEVTADTVKVYAGTDGAFLDDFNSIRVGDRIRVEFDPADAFLDGDGRCVIEKPYLVKKVEE